MTPARKARLRDLATIGRDIDAEHRACLASAADAVSHAINAGQLLIEAKAALKADQNHGQFIAWVKRHCPFSQDTAHRYMKLAKFRTHAEFAAPPSSINEALRMLSPPEPEPEPDEPEPEPQPAPTRPPPPPRPLPSKAEIISKHIDDFMVLIATVNAADTDEQQGWGGMRKVARGFTRYERRDVHNCARAMVEYIQDWLAILEA